MHPSSLLRTADCTPHQVALTHQISNHLQLVADQLRVKEAAAADDGTMSESQYHFCRALCAFADRAVDIVSTCQDDTLLPLVNLLFCCLGADLRVAELTVDFWASIQDTPLAQRHPQLGVLLYRELQMSSDCL